MDKDQEAEHLAQADRHIAELKSHIVRQREIIHKMVQTSHDTRLAESMLHAMEESLRAFERHRQLILGQLE